MEEQNRFFSEWVKDNRKELIIAGVSIATIFGIIVGYKNKDSIMKLWESLIKKLEESTVKMRTASCQVVARNVYKPEQVVVDISTMEIGKHSASHNAHVPFVVCDHIRNLPDGWHASERKIRTAIKYGYNINKGQTWVNKYTKVSSNI